MKKISFSGKLKKGNFINSGVYLLIIKVEKKISVNVGALGKIIFEKGYYVYTGSAQKNLIARINRHIRKDKRIKWHIDYLTTHRNVKVIGSYIIQAKKYYECMLSGFFIKHGNPISSFGCSDCKCHSHLIRLKFI